MRIDAGSGSWHMKREAEGAEMLSMDLHHLRVALLKISAVVLLGSTWVFTAFVLQTRPQPLKEGVGDAGLTALARLPASFPAQFPRLPGELPGVFSGTVKAQEPVRMDAVQVKCLNLAGDPPGTPGKDSGHQGLGRWVRLVGRICGQAESEGVRVENHTNGYTATVFPSRSDGTLTTDFIPLEPGSNQIVVKMRQKSGGAIIEKQISLTRQ